MTTLAGDFIPVEPDGEWQSLVCTPMPQTEGSTWSANEQSVCGEWWSIV